MKYLLLLCFLAISLKTAAQNLPTGDKIAIPQEREYGVSGYWRFHDKYANSDSLKEYFYLKEEGLTKRFFVPLYESNTDTWIFLYTDGSYSVDRNMDSLTVISCLTKWALLLKYGYDKKIKKLEEDYRNTAKDIGTESYERGFQDGVKAARFIHKYAK